MRKSRLTPEEATRRALRVKLVLTDCDGVLTDGGVYYGEHGEAFKRFSIRDGMGVERLRNAGIETAIITGESSPSVLRRAEKLKLRLPFLGIKDKRAQLDVILREEKISLGEIAYIGDDYNDLAILTAIEPHGLTGSPRDAMPKIRRSVHFVSPARGGHGAFRGFAEWILHLREAATSAA